MCEKAIEENPVKMKNKGYSLFKKYLILAVCQVLCWLLDKTDNSHFSELNLVRGKRNWDDALQEVLL